MDAGRPAGTIDGWPSTGATPAECPVHPAEPAREDADERRVPRAGWEAERASGPVLDGATCPDSPRASGGGRRVGLRADAWPGQLHGRCGPGSGESSRRTGRTAALPGRLAPLHVLQLYAPGRGPAEHVTGPLGGSGGTAGTGGGGQRDFLTLSRPSCHTFLHIAISPRYHTTRQWSSCVSIVCDNEWLTS